MQEKEVWKDVKNYKGYYQVSNLGRVKSLQREVSHPKGGLRTIKERVLKTNIKHLLYPCVSLCKDGVVKSFTVHKLVAISFLGHSKNSYLIVDHIDNNKRNNNLNNLRLITNRENVTRHIDSVGVSQNKYTKNWIARIYINGVREYLGTFKTKAEALKSYKDKIKQL